MRKIFKLLNKLYDKKIDGAGLAVFRVLYSIVLLCEISYMFYFRNLIFDEIPFIDKAEINFGIPIGLWAITAVFLLFGLFTRFTTILNYILGLILIGSMRSFEYHVYYAITSINFMFLFMPISKEWSLDKLVLKLRYTTARKTYEPPIKVSQLYYFVLLFFGIAFVYFDSIFFKLTSNNWLSGLGMWIPANLPMISHFEIPFLDNSKFITQSLGYVTLVFELIFIFFFWKKSFRWVFVIIGLGLHIGILLEFPIPWFALAVSGLYMTLVPVSVWRKLLGKRTKKSNYNLVFYYDAECPLCARTKVLIKHFDFYGKISFKTVQYDSENESKFNGIQEEDLLDNVYSIDQDGKMYSGVNTYKQVLKRLPLFYIFYLVLNISIAQKIAERIYRYVALNRNTERCTDESCGITTVVTPEKRDQFKILKNLTLSELKKSLVINVFVMLFLVQSVITIGTMCIRVPFIKDLTISKYYLSATSIVSKISPKLFGITNHGVFMDEHFNNYNHIISLYYVDKDGGEVRLPIVKEDGSPDWYIYGGNWCKWTFRTMDANVNMKRFTDGVQDFTAFWAGMNDISLDNAVFKLKVKKIDSPQGWELNFNKIQGEKPWYDAGYVIWENQVYAPHIKNIESL